MDAASLSINLQIRSTSLNEITIQRAREVPTSHPCTNSIAHKYLVSGRAVLFLVASWIIHESAVDRLCDFANLSSDSVLYTWVLWKLFPSCSVNLAGIILGE